MGLLIFRLFSRLNLELISTHCFERKEIMKSNHGGTEKAGRQESQKVEKSFATEIWKGMEKELKFLRRDFSVPPWFFSALFHRLRSFVL